MWSLGTLEQQNGQSGKIRTRLSEVGIMSLNRHDYARCLLAVPTQSGCGTAPCHRSQIYRHPALVGHAIIHFVRCLFHVLMKEVGIDPLTTPPGAIPNPKARADRRLKHGHQAQNSCEKIVLLPGPLRFRGRWDWRYCGFLMPAVEPTSGSLPNKPGRPGVLSLSNKPLRQARVVDVGLLLQLQSWVIVLRKDCPSPWSSPFSWPLGLACLWLSAPLSGFAAIMRKKVPE
ncbi:hypothetical protein DFJ77DRAFT_97667 [Powellomyces hirtus]|nr:hypothetical protein DFJ77DRAFT_97667 [Powellomyces hirtus]